MPKPLPTATSDTPQFPPGIQSWPPKLGNLVCRHWPAVQIKALDFAAALKDSDIAFALRSRRLPRSSSFQS